MAAPGRSALDGPAAWHSEKDGSIMMTVFFDVGTALFIILIANYAALRCFYPEQAAIKEEHLDQNGTFTPVKKIQTSSQGCTEEAIQILKSYDVDPDRGFLPQEDPLLDISKKYPRFKQWELIGTSLPDLLSAGQCRATIEAMDLVDWLPLKQDKRELHRAFLLLSAMCNAYIWCDPSAPAESIPKCLAVPLCEIANAVGSAPALTHGSIVLSNWRRLDQNGPISTQNITTLVDILGGRDEKWFFLVTVEVEAEGAATILPCLLLQMASESMSERLKASSKMIAQESIVAWCKHVTELLRLVAEGVNKMATSFRKMTQKCDPYIFYHRVRPFLSGSKGNPSLPDGVVYTDSTIYGNKRQQFSGGSAAQSSILQVVDATMGVAHSQEFLEEMQLYMPQKHREYIHFVQDKAKSGGSIRDILAAGNTIGTATAEKLGVISKAGGGEGLSANAFAAATKAYDECIDAITGFRNLHMEMVKVYIISEQRKIATHEARNKAKRSLGDAAGGKGTGGTGIMSFLAPVRNDTRSKKLGRTNHIS